MENKVGQFAQAARDTELRANAAEERASAAVATANEAERLLPEKYIEDRAHKKSFAEFLGEVGAFLIVPVPGVVARPLLEWTAAFRDQKIVTDRSMRRTRTSLSGV